MSELDLDFGGALGISKRGCYIDVNQIAAEKKTAKAMKKSQLKIMLGASSTLPLPLSLRICLRGLSGFAISFAMTGVVNAQNPLQKSATTPPVTRASTTPTTSAALSEPIRAALARKKVVVKAGVEVLENADAVKPGDIIEESATYSNVSDKTISQFVAQLPVPSNTELILNSLKPSLALASLDGAQFAPVPLKRPAPQPSSPQKGALLAATVLVPIPLVQYRFLRWSQNEVSPGKSVTVSARFRVLGDNLPNNDLNKQSNIQPARNDVTASAVSALGAKSTMNANTTASVGANK